jgi:hypothetical protein
MTRMGREDAAPNYFATMKVTFCGNDSRTKMISFIVLSNSEGNQILMPVHDFRGDDDDDDGGGKQQQKMIHRPL